MKTIFILSIISALALNVLSAEISSYQALSNDPRFHGENMGLNRSFVNWTKLSRVQFAYDNCELHTEDGKRLSNLRLKFERIDTKSKQQATESFGFHDYTHQLLFSHDNHAAMVEYGLSSTAYANLVDLTLNEDEIFGYSQFNNQNVKIKVTTPILNENSLLISIFRYWHVKAYITCNIEVK